MVTGAVVALGIGLSGDAKEPTAEPPEPLATTLADLEPATMTVARASFCGEVPTADVEAAVLGGAPSSSASGSAADSTGTSAEVTGTAYADGERAAVTADVTDVAHEFDCTWRTGDGREARAWVFAPPVTAERARELATDAARQQGCRPAAGLSLGTPGGAVSCPAGKGLARVTAYALLGDAWLTCSLTGRASEPPADLVDRADRWCATVLTAASAQ